MAKIYEEAVEIINSYMRHIASEKYFDGEWSCGPDHPNIDALYSKLWADLGWPNGKLPQLGKERDRYKAALDEVLPYLEKQTKKEPSHGDVKVRCDVCSEPMTFPNSPKPPGVVNHTDTCWLGKWLASTREALEKSDD